MFRPTRFALGAPQLQKDYDKVWDGFNRRNARPGAEELGRVGERARLRLPDPEPAVRHLQAQGREGIAARRRRDRRPDPRPRGARHQDRADAERPRGDGPRRVEAAAQGAVARACRSKNANKRFATLPAADEAGRAVPAGGDRRLHRLLHRHPPRHQHGTHAASRQPAAAELQVGADRLSRPQLVDRRLGHAQVARPARPDQGARRRRARVRSLAGGSTTRPSSASSSARATRSGKPIADRRRARPRVRRGAAQRLVGARHPGLGIPAARAVPRQELRHHHLAVDRHARGARAVSLPRVRARRGRSEAAALPVGRGRPARRRLLDRGGNAPAHARR